MHRHHSRDTAAKQWNETWVLALTSAARLYRAFLSPISERRSFAAAWDGLEGLVDEERFEGVKARFAQQVRDAGVMRDAILSQYTSWYHRRWPPAPE